MNPIALGLIVLGGLVQVAAIVLYALSDAIQFPLLIAAIVLGSLIEGAGIAVIVLTSRR